MRGLRPRKESGLPRPPVRSVGAGVGLESHLAKEGVGAQSNGDGVDHQQEGQQQLEGGVSKQLLDIHASDELLDVPGILGKGERPSFRQVSRGRPQPGRLFSVNGGPYGPLYGEKLPERGLEMGASI